MTDRPPQRNRGHNFRIVGTIQNQVEDLSLDWQSLDSKLLAAAAYLVPRQVLYLRFQTGQIYRYFGFPIEQYHALLDADSHGRYFLRHIRNCFPYERLTNR